MKKLSLFLIAILALSVSCEKPMSEADRNAQIEREVQQRLAAERQAADKERLAQQKAELDAREKALAERESAAREALVAAATPMPTAEPVVQEEERSGSSPDRGGARSYDTFYRKLEPYGAWRETGDYGFVWQPRAAQESRDWRPYTDGRWAYTDAGWTWVSVEPFGWATYHYGRWTRLRGVGWVWVPGEEWAPAWVSWRTSSQHVGWAPLPPEARFERRTGIRNWADSYYDIGADEYVFIPNEEIGSENVVRSVVPFERNFSIVIETNNVTNITYTNTTIVNEGPNYEELRRHSRRPFERLRLQREYDLREDQTTQPSVRGNVLAVMTPLFTARATQRPRNLGAPIQQATVERDWATNANQPEAQRARAKMKAEAAPKDAPSKRFQKPIVLEGVPAPGPVATAIPAVGATATPVVTPPPAFTPRPTRPPRRGPFGTPVPLATSTPAAKPIQTPLGIATPDPMGIATPVPTPFIKPARKPAFMATPIPGPRRGVTDPPERDVQEGSGIQPNSGRDAQREARDEARNARMREEIARRAARPTPPPNARPMVPKTVMPPPTVAPSDPAAVIEPSEAARFRKSVDPRAVPRVPKPVRVPRTEPPVVGGAPNPAANKAKAQDQDAASAKPTATPSDRDEP